MAGEIEDPDPGLIRFCHRHPTAVRMEVRYELAADVLPYLRCPVCKRVEPFVTHPKPG